MLRIVKLVFIHMPRLDFGSFLSEGAVGGLKGQPRSVNHDVVQSVVARKTCSTDGRRDTPSPITSIAFARRSTSVSLGAPPPSNDYAPYCEPIYL